MVISSSSINCVLPYLSIPNCPNASKSVNISPKPICSFPTLQKRLSPLLETIFLFSRNKAVITLLDPSCKSFVPYSSRPTLKLETLSSSFFFFFLDPDPDPDPDPCCVATSLDFLPSLTLVSISFLYHCKYCDCNVDFIGLPFSSFFPLL